MPRLTVLMSDEEWREFLEFCRSLPDYPSKSMAAKSAILSHIRSLSKSQVATSRTLASPVDDDEDVSPEEMQRRIDAAAKAAKSRVTKT